MLVSVCVEEKKKKANILIRQSRIQRLSDGLAMNSYKVCVKS